MMDISELDLTPTMYVQYNDKGEVLARGSVAQHILTLYEDQGQRILRIPGALRPDNFKALLDSDDYVDLSGDRAVLRPRPTWSGDFSPAPVLPKQEAVMAAVPPCEVAITGPVTGTHAHPGGDLKIGFTLPGVYTISFEAFPYMPVVRTLTVNPATTVSATAGVKL